MAAVVTSPLVEPIAEALHAAYPAALDDLADWLPEAEVTAAACIAVVAALPADYTAVDVLAFLRGDDVPSEPLPVADHCICGKPATHLAAGPDSREWACRVPEVTA